MRPAKGWFAVAGLVATAGVVGAVAATVVAVDAYGDRIESFERRGLPATLHVEITETGGYSIYQEYTGANDGFFRPGLEVTVTDPSGGPVTLERYDSSVTYQGRGHEGRGEFTFDAAETGVYTVTATGSTGSTVAVGRGIGPGLIVGVGAALLLGFGGVVGGAVIAIVVGVRRSRSRRALLPMFEGWGPPPPGGWGPPAPPSGGWAPRPPGAPLPPPPGAPPPPPPGAPPPPSRGWGPGPAGPVTPPETGGRRPAYPYNPPPPADAPPPLPSDALPRGPSDAPPAPPRPRAASSLPPPGRPRDAVPWAGDGGIADPPSLRSLTDWSRSEIPLHWSARR
ncbi:MAG TPA: hypothetical protein VFZ79_09955 [Acidimicrobiales bacterium]